MSVPLDIVDRLVVKAVEELGTPVWAEMEAVVVAAAVEEVVELFAILDRQPRLKR